MTGYAWIVTNTKGQDLSAPDEYKAPLIELPEDESSNGTTGPHDAPDDLIDRLKAGEGRVWRTLYDVDFDGHTERNRVVHIGRYLDYLDVPVGEYPGGREAFLRDGVPDVDDDGEFGPLHDFSGPDSGAVSIQYRQENGSWKTF